MDLALLEQEALKLSDADRAVLADHLLGTLEATTPSVMDAWAKEGEKRLEAFRNGKEESVEVNDFLKTLRNPSK